MDKVADSFLEPRRPLAGIDELALGRDPENRFRASQDGPAPPQEGQATACCSDLDAKKPQPFEERILREALGFDRGK